MVGYKSLCLIALDHIIVLTFFTPLVVAHWWGTWALLDIYIYPDDVIKRAITSLLIGCLGMTSLYCLQDVLIWIDRNTSSVVWLIFNNFYIATVVFCNICHWHAIWAFGAIVVEKAERINHSQLPWYGIMFVTALTILIKTRTLKNVIGAPIVCGVDLNPELYQCPTRFKQKWKPNGLLFILDCCFSELVIHTLIPLFWLAPWSIVDIIIGHLSFLENYLICVSMGAFLAIVTYTLQIPVSKACKRLEYEKSHWIWKCLVEQLFYFIGGAASISSWRGWWLLYTGHLQFSSSEVAGPWLGSVRGLFILLRFLAGSSALAKGVQTDGDFNEGEGGILSTQYIRYFIERSQHSKDVCEDDLEECKSLPVEDT